MLNLSYGFAHPYWGVLGVVLAFLIVSIKPEPLKSDPPKPRVCRLLKNRYRSFPQPGSKKGCSVVFDLTPKITCIFWTPVKILQILSLIGLEVENLPFLTKRLSTCIMTICLFRSKLIAPTTIAVGYNSCEKRADKFLIAKREGTQDLPLSISLRCQGMVL